MFPYDQSIEAQTVPD